MAGIGQELKKILESSETLKPDFLQQQQIVPYYLSKRTKKKLREVFASSCCKNLIALLRNGVFIKVKIVFNRKLEARQRGKDGST